MSEILISETLKPCQCGGEAKYIPAYGVECRKCGMKMPATFDEHVRLWNHRPLEQELVEALKGTPGLGFSWSELERRFDRATVDRILQIERLIKKAEGKSPNNQTDGVA